MILLLLIIHTILPEQMASALAKPATMFMVSIIGSIVLLLGTILGTLRHKEASPFILSVLAVVCVFLLGIITSAVLQGIAIVALLVVIILSFLLHHHTLDIPKAPSMSELLHNPL